MEKELKQFSQQSWTDEKFCKQYAETWEISTDEVHYGWLAPGEATLKLFHEIDLPKSNVLDKDVINCLHDVGFTVERIVEQQTLNPSQISYEDSKKFPYHFHRKKNPCRAEFDANSNGGPHTIIYKVKKPDRGAIFNRQMSLEIGFGKIRVWGEERIIRDVREFKSADNKYTIYELAPIDSVVGFCNVLSFKVESRDLGKKQKISLNVGPQRPEWRDIMAGSLLGMIAKRLRGTKLKCYFQEDWIPIDETKKFLRAIFISRIDPIFEKIINHFPNQEIGLLIFVNGEEPASGKVGAQEFFPTIGDKIDVVYVILKRGCIWTYRGPHLGDQFELSGSQLSFFTWENS